MHKIIYVLQEKYFWGKQILEGPKIFLERKTNVVCGKKGFWRVKKMGGQTNWFWVGAKISLGNKKVYLKKYQLSEGTL